MSETLKEVLHQPGWLSVPLKLKKDRGQRDWLMFVKNESVMMDDGRQKAGVVMSQGLRSSSSIWRLLEGQRSGWLEQFVL